jgi:hypothetical protein
MAARSDLREPKLGKPALSRRRDRRRRIRGNNGSIADDGSGNFGPVAQ